MRGATPTASVTRSSCESWNAISTTLERSAPLIAAGLGVTVAFRAGLFNIGAQGQLLIGALAAGYVGFTWDLPPGLHLLVALVAGLVTAAAPEIGNEHARSLRDGLRSLQLAFAEALPFPDDPGKAPGEKYTGRVS